MQEDVLAVVLLGLDEEGGGARPVGGHAVLLAIQDDGPLVHARVVQQLAAVCPGRGRNSWRPAGMDGSAAGGWGGGAGSAAAAASATSVVWLNLTHLRAAVRLYLETLLAEQQQSEQQAHRCHGSRQRETAVLLGGHRPHGSRCLVFSDPLLDETASVRQQEG